MSEKKKTLTMIDPPSGWQYGFPKELPNNYRETGFDIREWLVTEGYPRELIISYGEMFCYRTWEIPLDENLNQLNS
jgi:hypothetical protein